MNEIAFYKMSGAGNDFLMIDAQDGIDYQALTIAACDRTNGVGADGVIIFDQSKSADYKMRIINADGSEAEMCGNGARCFARYIKLFKNPSSDQFTIETLAGQLIGDVRKADTVTVQLSDPLDVRFGETITVDEQSFSADHIDTGVPHAVIFVEELKNISVNALGETIRFHDQYKPRGANVNFVETINPNRIAVRTYERGVEAETKACGTGSVAAAIMAYCRSHTDQLQVKGASMEVVTASGEVLTVTFDIDHEQINHVWLTGGARLIAKGCYYFEA